MTVYSGRRALTLTLTLVLTTGLITIFILVISVIGKWSVARANTLTHQTPTCTPIILDGLAVKCVMWGSARATPTGTETLNLASYW